MVRGVASGSGFRVLLVAIHGEAMVLTLFLIGWKNSLSGHLGDMDAGECRTIIRVINARTERNERMK